MATKSISTLEQGSMAGTAKGFHIRISPYKLRRVANVVRGKESILAEALLKQLPQKGARLLLKILQSAIANARYQSPGENKSLFISELMVNEGSHFKRFQPRARGRIYKVIKRTCHVNLSVSTKQQGAR